MLGPFQIVLQGRHGLVGLETDFLSTSVIYLSYGERGYPCIFKFSLHLILFLFFILVLID